MGGPIEDDEYLKTGWRETVESEYYRTSALYCGFKQYDAEVG